MARWLKMTGVELELLTYIDILLMAEKGIKDGKYDAIHRYTEANNKHMKDYDENIDSSNLVYLDANNLYEWAMPQKLPANGFKCVEDLPQFNESFIKNYDGNSHKEYNLEVDVEHSKNLFNHHKDYSFLPERKKIKKCNVTYIADHIRVIKQALNNELRL